MLGLLGGAGEERREGEAGLRLGDEGVIVEVAVVVGLAEGALGLGVEAVGLAVGAEVRPEGGAEARCHFKAGLGVHHAPSLGKRNANYAGATALVGLCLAADEANEAYVLRTR